MPEQEEDKTEEAEEATMSTEQKQTAADVASGKLIVGETKEEREGLQGTQQGKRNKGKVQKTESNGDKLSP